MIKQLLAFYASGNHKSNLLSFLCLSLLMLWSPVLQAQSPENKVFYRGINLGPDETSLVVDGHVFHHSSHYPEDHEVFGRLFQNQNVTLLPTTDANRARMIRSCIYSTKSELAGFKFYGIVPGYYDVYVYVWEDNYASTYSLRIGPNDPITHNSGGKGKWSKLGPFRAFALRGELAISAFGGDGNLSAIELWKIEETEPTFERALNLNSSANLLIEGKNFEGSKNASGFTFTGRTFENQYLPVTPETDGNTKKMLRSCIYSTRTVPAVLTLNTATEGDYLVYLYRWEDNYPSQYSLKINRIMFQMNSSTGTQGTWEKLGPYLVTAGFDKKIVIEAYGGDMNLSGVEIHLFSFDPDRYSRVAPALAENDVNSITAYPNPIADQLHINFPVGYHGKATLTLTDLYGKIHLVQNKEIGINKPIDLGFKGENLKPGVYFLKVKAANSEKTIRLVKE